MRAPEQLLPLVDYGIIDEVIRPLMSGKEASVYVVRAQGNICAAKVYKESINRSFRQRSEYAEGRSVRNSRQKRAMAKGSRYGKSLLEENWQNAEVDCLYRLDHAGVRVPIPIHYSDNVLLMEMVMDEEGYPAPRLWDYNPTPDEACRIHEFLIRQIVRMLCAGVVHGDLSEYNILMSADGPVIIDFPQATDAANNQNSERIFLRDVKNLKNYLGRYAPKIKKTQFGREIWDFYRQGKLFPDTPLTGRVQRKNKKVDTASVVAEILASAKEANAKPMSAYQKKKQKQLESTISQAQSIGKNRTAPRPMTEEEIKKQDAALRKKRQRNRKRKKGPKQNTSQTRGTSDRNRSQKQKPKPNVSTRRPRKKRD